MISNFLKRRKKRLITLGSALGTAGVMYAVWGGSLFVLIALSVVMFHELGHILAANYAGASVGHTFFIPLFFGILGATQIYDIPLDKEALVAILGPIFGLLAALAVGLIVYLLKMELLFVPILLLVMFEMFNLLFGSDAKKYKEAKRVK